MHASCVELYDSRCEDGAQRPNDVKHFFYFLPFFLSLKVCFLPKSKRRQNTKVVTLPFRSKKQILSATHSSKKWHTRQGRNTETPSSAAKRPQANPLPTSLCRAMLLGCCGLRPRVAANRVICQNPSGLRTFRPRRTHQDRDCVSGVIVIGR